MVKHKEQGILYYCNTVKKKNLIWHAIKQAEIMQWSFHDHAFFLPLETEQK